MATVRNSAIALMALASAVAFGSPARADLLMDFGTGSGSAEKVFAPYTQDGLTMTPVFDGDSAGAPHWDIIQSGNGASASDNSARIHYGNAGEKVAFTFAGPGLISLMGIDIENIDLVNAKSAGVLFTASSGATYSTSSIGHINFGSMAGWAGITSFTMEVLAPVSTYSCGPTTTANCSGIVFDNIDFVDPPALAVPEPLTVSLFGAGIAGLAALRRRKKTA